MSAFRGARPNAIETKRRYAMVFARYRQYADKQMDMCLNKKLGRDIFEEPARRSGKLNGMGMLLATFGREYGVLHSA